MTARAITFRLRKHADYQRVYKASRKQFGKQMTYFFALRPQRLRAKRIMPATTAA